MAVGSFGMILLLSREGFEADQLEDFKGLNRKSPWFAAIMMMLMFSTAGVPPFIGFWAKLAVHRRGARRRPGVARRGGRAAVGRGAFYYLRVIKLMYFDEPTDSHRDPGRRHAARRAQRQRRRRAGPRRFPVSADRSLRSRPALESRAMRWSPFTAVVAAIAALLAFRQRDLLAQRAEENVTTDSEDAFGRSIGNESIGIYNEGDVRGFSPIEAGNVRLEGLYFDRLGTPDLAPGRRLDDPRRHRLAELSVSFADGHRRLRPAARRRASRSSARS